MENLTQHLFDPVHSKAPSFVSLLFLVGAWGVMLGALPLFEIATRNLRKTATQHPQGWFRINGKRTTPETFEKFLCTAAYFGRVTAKIGAALMAAAVAATIWRA